MSGAVELTDTAEDLAATPKPYTGHLLKPVLEAAEEPRRKRSGTRR